LYQLKKLNKKPPILSRKVKLRGRAEKNLLPWGVMFCSNLNSESKDEDLP
jgi:hypothetical protein